MTKSSTSGSSQVPPGRTSTRDSKPSAKKVAAFQAKSDSIQQSLQKQPHSAKSSSKSTLKPIRASTPPTTAFSQIAASGADSLSDESGQLQPAKLTVCLACDKGQNRRCARLTTCPYKRPYVTKARGMKGDTTTHVLPVVNNVGGVKTKKTNSERSEAPNRCRAKQLATSRSLSSEGAVPEAPDARSGPSKSVHRASRSHSRTGSSLPSQGKQANQPDGAEPDAQGKTRPPSDAAASRAHEEGPARCSSGGSSTVPLMRRFEDLPSSWSFLALEQVEDLLATNHDAHFTHSPHQQEASGVSPCMAEANVLVPVPEEALHVSMEHLAAGMLSSNHDEPGPEGEVCDEWWRLNLGHDNAGEASQCMGDVVHVLHDVPADSMVHVADTPEVELSLWTPSEPLPGGGDTDKPSASRFRGVQRHTWTGMFEARLRCDDPRLPNTDGEVFLGAYELETTAAHVHDLVALKVWGPEANPLNFCKEKYAEHMRLLAGVDALDLVNKLQRESSGFGRSAGLLSFPRDCSNQIATLAAGVNAQGPFTSLVTTGQRSCADQTWGMLGVSTELSPLLRAGAKLKLCGEGDGASSSHVSPPAKRSKTVSMLSISPTTEEEVLDHSHLFAISENFHMEDIGNFSCELETAVSCSAADPSGSGSDRTLSSSNHQTNFSLEEDLIGKLWQTQGVKSVLTKRIC